MMDTQNTRMRNHFAATLAVAAFALGAVLPAPTFAQEASSQATELPPVFAETFLHFPEDVADAAKSGKRLLIYFGQDGCPYCKRFLETSFSQKAIVDLTQSKFLAVGLNIWGDRETTWFDGIARSEKALAKHLQVQITPTVLLFDEKGKVIARINGYYPPHRFAAALDYAAQRLESKRGFAEHMLTVPTEGARAKLNEQSFFLKAAAGKPLDLRRKPGGKPLAVLFETTHCAPCDELHDDAFKRENTLAALRSFDVARFSLNGSEAILPPGGVPNKATTAQAWAKTLKIAYTPGVVFFDNAGKEVFRLEGYVRPFHFVSSFEYVGSGAYRKEAQFQRFLQNKADLTKAQGEKLELMK
jgi:thioredoxin-related protein